MRVTRRTNPPASTTPNPNPAAVPTTPTAAASPSTRAKISRRVTPSARSVPISTRRRTTEKVTLL